MAAALFSLWQNALEDRTVGHDTVRVRVDLEMTKKQLEERLAQLEKPVMGLQSQLLSLALRQPFAVTIPAPIQVEPNYVPYYPPQYPTYPYIGDPVPGTPGYPTVTRGSATIQRGQKRPKFELKISRRRRG